MPKISVISIAKKEEELENLRQALAAQSFQDLELIISTEETIPKAWNDALSRATGEFIVFTESDAIPLNNQWLKEMLFFAKKNTIIKGIEINPKDLNLCNLICDAEIFKKFKFNESFKFAEDTELFARLRKEGIKIECVKGFPVIHTPKKSWKKTITRSFLYGLYFIKIIYLHGKKNIDDVNTRCFQNDYINPISLRFIIITENILILLGLLIGSIFYLPILLKNFFLRS